MLFLYFDASGHIERLSLVPLVSAGSQVCVCAHLCVCPGLAGGEMDEMGREEEKWATEEGMKDEGIDG